jgi:hypothetical protein
MIFPERVFGMSGTIQTFFGRAIFPISVSIAFVTFCSISPLLALMPGLSETYISTARPRSSSITGTAAASAISSTVMMLGRVIKWARNGLTMRLEANLRWLDRTQEVAGSSPASSIAYLPDSPTG